ncbi:MotE family protein [Hyphobacterium sp.]|uniref:MotE family protein n=1 Tax=Hyphobacterium sp. TaxID=2004662 RepID=UPI0037483B27
MRPVRLLATAAVLAGGLFVLKALEVGVGAADALAAWNLSDDAADTTPEEVRDDTNEAVSPLPDNSIGEQTCTPAQPSADQSALFASRVGLSPSQRDVLTSLSERRNELDGRARELDTREQLLEAAEIRIDERITELRTLRDDIETLLGTLDEEEEAEIVRLVSIYNNMEVDAAAERLAALDPQTQVQIVTRMAARKAGEIMGEMDVRDAAVLTALIAARREVPETAAELEARIGTEG